MTSLPSPVASTLGAFNISAFCPKKTPIASINPLELLTENICKVLSCDPYVVGK